MAVSDRNFYLLFPLLAKWMYRESNPEPLGGTSAGTSGFTIFTMQLNWEKPGNPDGIQIDRLLLQECWGSVNGLASRRISK